MENILPEGRKHGPGCWIFFTDQVPKTITLNGKKLKPDKDKARFDEQATGWYLDPANQKGILHIKTRVLSTEVTSIIGLKQKR